MQLLLLLTLCCDCCCHAVQDVSPKYNALMNLVGRGDKTYGQRLSETAAMDSFLLRRSKEELLEMFPASEQVRHVAAAQGKTRGRSSRLCCNVNCANISSSSSKVSSISWPLIC